MEKTSTLNKKLKSYSAIAGTLIAAGSSADAQIVYTDIADVTLTPTGTDFYNLDLDNGGFVDFQLVTATGVYTYGSFGTFPYNYAFVAPNPAATTNAIDTLGGPVVHALNDPIGSTNLWEDATSASYQLLGLAFTTIAFSDGPFLGTTDAYIGLRFDLSGATHYGWVRVDVSSDAGTVVIKDYAYDATPNTMIPAGATVTTAIAENLADNANIFAYDNIINVQVKNNLVGTVVVTDALGREVAKEAINNANLAISMQDKNAGIYFVTVKQDAGIFTKKVVIK